MKLKLTLTSLSLIQWSLPLPGPEGEIGARASGANRAGTPLPPGRGDATGQHINSVSVSRHFYRPTSGWKLSRGEHPIYIIAAA